MDYSKLIEASEAADFAYAKWYSSLPDEQKVRFFLSGFDFVANRIRDEVKKENPFASEASVTLRFIESTQKEDYPEEVMSFIRTQMSVRSEKEWKERFRKMKKALGWSYEEMAAFIGAKSGASLKASVSRKLPAFAKLAVCVFEQLTESKKAP